MRGIRVRLRKRLRFYSRDAAMLGQMIEVASVPARTTLCLTEIQGNGALAVDPQGQRFFVSIETLRQFAYDVPRGAT